MRVDPLWAAPVSQNHRSGTVSHALIRCLGLIVHWNTKCLLFVLCVSGPSNMQTETTRFIRTVNYSLSVVNIVLTFSQSIKVNAADTIS